MMFPTGGEWSFLTQKKGLEWIVRQAGAEKIAFKKIGLKITGLSEMKLLWHFVFGKRYYQKYPVMVK